MEKFALGLSTAFSRSADRDTLLSFAAAGVKCVELSTTYERYRDVFRIFDRSDELRRNASDAGIELWSLHLPFSGEIDISHPDDGLRDRAIELDRECLTAASRLGCSVAVIHPSSEPIEQCDRAGRMLRSRDALLRLAEFSASLGVRLALEDLPRTCLGRSSDEMLELLDGNEPLSVCFDTNHLLGQDNAEFVRSLGDKIITLHVSDYDFIDERHQLPFEGKNDWGAIISALRAAGYAGPWLYELSRNPSPGRRTGKVLTPEDMAENYARLMKM